MYPEVVLIYFILRHTDMEMAIVDKNVFLFTDFQKQETKCNVGPYGDVPELVRRKRESKKKMW